MEKDVKPLSSTSKPDISYPCQWQYKVIGKDRILLEEAIAIICEGMEYTLRFSNTSSSGKYCSLNVETHVTDEEHRNTIFEQFQQHTAVTMVI